MPCFFPFQLRTNEKTVEELRAANHALQDRLEGLYKGMSLSPASAAAAAAAAAAGSGNMSLLNEMELSDSERSMNHSRRQMDEEEDDVECEHPPGTNMATLETKEVRTNIYSF